MTTRGVLVVGGRGERLGLGLPKAHVLVGGETLLARALATLGRVCDEVVVAAPATMEVLLPTGAVPARRVADLEPGAGPLAGLVAGLEDAGFERAVALGVDFPFARSEALSVILSRLESAGSPAAVPAPEGRLQPLFAAYARAAARPLATDFAAGERSVVRAVERLEPEVLPSHLLATLPGGLDNFFNLNTPEDLITAERRLGRGRP
jgi:molybdopterin-guanine dinucleotide biosynthesis protein A